MFTEDRRKKIKAGVLNQEYAYPHRYVRNLKG
jgi:hypothetical protein